jgi:hypothetical protein
MHLHRGPCRGSFRSRTHPRRNSPRCVCLKRGFLSHIQAPARWPYRALSGPYKATKYRKFQVASWTALRVCAPTREVGDT